jgi:DNA modification methylase
LPIGMFRLRMMPVISPLASTCLKCRAWRGELGAEPTPKLYVEHIVEVFREVKRVLRDDGTLWLNLGDSYNAYNGNRGRSSGFNKNNHDELPALPTGYGLGDKSLKPKDLLGIPWSVALALRDDGWYLRQDIIWAKPNQRCQRGVMPESVHEDAHEYLFLMTKSDRYYCDMDAIKEPLATRWGTQDRRPCSVAATNSRKRSTDESAFWRTAASTKRIMRCRESSIGLARESVSGDKGAHFATFPTALVEPCILAGCPVRRIGLDPFNGSGTTGEVCLMHDRNYIGVERNMDYVKLTQERWAKSLKPKPKKRIKPRCEKREPLLFC